MSASSAGGSARASRETESRSTVPPNGIRRVLTIVRKANGLNMVSSCQDFLKKQIMALKSCIRIAPRIRILAGMPALPLMRNATKAMTVAPKKMPVSVN